ncbi:hypothetical protein [Nannocystis pusilla]|uniref:Tetratricopeptide repeat protein n=1 Tax=Nannocystis pusilla TaxID=889268 RepID=A0ABS7TRE4_9BACT|nr:hypothetical protein [Nannocystis pusilla]MBZ5710795.1 hypothetical protein [Nannocystis pusilla]
MNDSERVSDRIFARFREAERPPLFVDALVLERLRHEHRAAVAARLGMRRSLVRAVVITTAVVAVLVLVLIRIEPWRLLDGAGAPTGTAASRYHDEAPSLDATRSRPEDRRPATRRPGEERPAGVTTAAPATPSSPPGDRGFVLLKEAGALIKSRKYDEALEILRSCRAAVGSDDLAEECDMLEIEAYCGSGRKEVGTAKVAAFLRAWPRSQHENRLRRTCR